MSDDPNPFDCVIVGGGPAGLSAALTLGRARRNVVVIDNNHPINETVEHSHGFLTRDGVGPGEFRALARAEIEPYGVKFLEDEVSSVALNETVEVRTRSAVFPAKRLLLASGAAFDLPPIPGLIETWGVGSANCPYCHGWEWRDAEIGVLAGSAQHASRLAVLLKQWSPHVTVYANTAELDDDPGYKVVRGRVKAVEHAGRQVTGIRLQSGDVFPCNGLFLASLPRCRDTLLKELGLEMGEGGFPKVDPTGLTSENRVWVAGNATTPASSLILAAATGFMAATSINTSLSFE